MCVETGVEDVMGEHVSGERGKEDFGNAEILIQFWCDSCGVLKRFRAVGPFDVSTGHNFSGRLKIWEISCS